MSKRKDRYRSFKRESKRIKLTDGTLFDKIRIHKAIDGTKIRKKISQELKSVIQDLASKNIEDSEFNKLSPIKKL